MVRARSRAPRPRAAMLGRGLRDGVGDLDVATPRVADRRVAQRVRALGVLAARATIREVALHVLVRVRPGGMGDPAAAMLVRRLRAALQLHLGMTAAGAAVANAERFAVAQQARGEFDFGHKGSPLMDSHRGWATPSLGGGAKHIALTLFEA